MKKRILTVASMLVVGFGLSACFEEETSEAEEKEPTTEVSAPAQPAAEEPSEQVSEAPKDEGNVVETSDMTPAEAFENMKRDAGRVADKAGEIADGVMKQLE